MATVTIYADTTARGTVYSDGGTKTADYATVRTGDVLNVTGVCSSGQWFQTPTHPHFRIFEGFVAFDTSTTNIPAAAVLDSATLYAQFYIDVSTTNFILEARLGSFLPNAPTTTDWVPGDNLSGLTKLATFNTVDIVDLNTYYALTSEAALLTNINRSGYTQVLYCSAETTDNSEPGGKEYVFQDAGMGVGVDPKLVIEYHLPATGFVVINTSSVA